MVMVNVTTLSAASNAATAFNALAAVDVLGLGGMVVQLADAETLRAGPVARSGLPQASGAIGQHETTLSCGALLRLARSTSSRYAA